MGIYRIRSEAVGRPFPTGNPGGGRPKGVPNKATLEIKDFGRNFLMSDQYRENLKRRIMAGKAPHMEVLLHQYAFGKPKQTLEIPPPPTRRLVEQVKLLNKEERMQLAELSRKMIDRQWAQDEIASPQAVPASQ